MLFARHEAQYVWGEIIIIWEDLPDIRTNFVCAGSARASAAIIDRISGRTIEWKKTERFRKG